MSQDNFSQQWINLAQPQLGAEVISTSDDFFAAKEALIKTEAPVFIDDKYDDNGKWMDGWESRRRRDGGHDHCIIRLGHPGRIHGVNIDTSHFTGNYPPQASIEACMSNTSPDENTEWQTLLPQSDINGDSYNLFAIDNDAAYNYVRFNIFPDGGVARLRLYGEIRPNWDGFDADESINLLAVENGARALACNNEHYGSMHNIIKSQPPINMGDGWETRRRRKPGNDWAVFALGRRGVIEKINVNTHFFKGNYPHSCSIRAANLDTEDTEEIIQQSSNWPELLPRSLLSADNEHIYETIPDTFGPVTHVRLDIYPDGGISRLKLFGKASQGQA